MFSWLEMELQHGSSTSPLDKVSIYILFTYYTVGGMVEVGTG